jgi:hypothetical protein
MAAADVTDPSALQGVQAVQAVQGVQTVQGVVFAGDPFATSERSGPSALQPELSLAMLDAFNFAPRSQSFTRDPALLRRTTDDGAQVAGLRTEPILMESDRSRRLPSVKGLATSPASLTFERVAGRPRRHLTDRLPAHSMRSLTPPDAVIVNRLAADVVLSHGRGTGSWCVTATAVLVAALEALRAGPAATVPWDHALQLVSCTLQSLADRNALAPRTTESLRTLLNTPGLLKDVANALVAASNGPPLGVIAPRPPRRSRSAWWRHTFLARCCCTASIIDGTGGDGRHHPPPAFRRPPPLFKRRPS